MSDLQHPDSRPFELVADVYERARPEYPAAAIAWLAERLDLRAGRTVLDLGAGTGKLTRALLPTGARVVAVEPGAQMLGQLRRVLPEVEAQLGAAEAIPLADASVDAITVGQAFHWFRHDEALPEMRRVLRRHGAVCLIWNARDRQWDVSKLLEDFIPSDRAAPGTWSDKLAASELFGAVEQRRFQFVQTLDADGLVDRIFSISFVAAAPEQKRAALERKLRALVAEHGGQVELPYVTDVYVSYAA
ncbi:MAG TPA: class I SAM-dependent methyltransferase [Gaiellaceae bacterium]